MSEPAALKLFEHSWYTGTVLNAIVYGINLSVYFQIIRTLFMARNDQSVPFKAFYAVFSTVMILLVSAGVSVAAVWGETMWITDRDKPGGVLFFLATETNPWYQMFSRACTYTMVLLADLFLTYRLYIVWASSYRVVVLPALASLAAFVLAILQLVLQGDNLNFFRDGKVINLGTPYYSLTLSINVTVTLLIVYRLRQLRKEVSGAIGHDGAKVYSDITAMVIESAAPYTLTAIAWIIPYARGNSTSVAFGLVSDEFSCLSPLMIILRVLNRKGWSKNLVSQIETGRMQFKTATGAAASGAQNNVNVSIQEHGRLPAEGTMRFEEWNSSSQSTV